MATIDEVLNQALTRETEPIEWPERDPVEPLQPTAAKDEIGEVVTH